MCVRVFDLGGPWKSTVDIPGPGPFVFPREGVKGIGAQCCGSGLGIAFTVLAFFCLFG